MRIIEKIRKNESVSRLWWVLTLLYLKRAINISNLFLQQFVQIIRHFQMIIEMNKKTCVKIYRKEMSSGVLQAITIQIFRLRKFGLSNDQNFVHWIFQIYKYGNLNFIYHKKAVGLFIISIGKVFHFARILTSFTKVLSVTNLGNLLRFAFTRPSLRWNYWAFLNRLMAARTFT